VAQRGRQPVLDDAKKSQIVTILGVGCSQRIAARYVGCSEGTIRNTARRDPVFAERILEARREAEVGLLKNIRSAAEKSQYWRAAAWALERIFPQRYARRGPDVITVDQIGRLMVQFIDAIHRELPEEHRDRVIDRLHALVGDMLAEAARKRGGRGSSEAPDDDAPAPREAPHKEPASPQQPQALQTVQATTDQ
jgi:hypothetical protein